MKNTENNRGEAWYSERIEYLSEFMLPERVGRLKQVLDLRTRYITVMAENFFHTQNASALVRHCDAFGLQKMHAVEELCRFKPNVNIVKGTDKWVELCKYATTGQALDAVKAAGYRIIATAPHQGDCQPADFDIGQGPFALVFGTEHEGISDEVALRADGFIRIPMYGFVESLNVSASAAIIIHILTERLRSSGIPWRLSEDEKLPILFEWMCRSVRGSRKLLERFNM